MYQNKARNFIYRNARPLDVARWKYLFEDGRQEDVIIALTCYQNDDGGFGHALEPDCWNEESSPVQTWVATEIIKEIHLEDKTHPLIQGILRYLSSGKHFNGHTWWNTIVSNDRYPHAPWWTHDIAQESSYNPTASLLGFIIKFADCESALYKQACELTKEAYCYFKAQVPMESMHTAACFVDLYEYLQESTILDRAEFKELLQKQIKYLLTNDKSTWTTDYVCKPSLFIHSKKSDFYMNNKDICDYERDFIKRTQEVDGSWAITWSWSDYNEEWSISKNWWKSDLIIRNTKFVEAMHE